MRSTRTVSLLIVLLSLAACKSSNSRSAIKDAGTDGAAAGAAMGSAQAVRDQNAVQCTGSDLPAIKIYEFNAERPTWNDVLGVWSRRDNGMMRLDFGILAQGGDTESFFEFKDELLKSFRTNPSEELMGVYETGGRLYEEEYEYQPTRSNIKCRRN